MTRESNVLSESELWAFIEEHRRVQRRRWRFMKLTVSVMLVVLVVVSGGFAWFSSQGSGSASASVGVLNAPSNVVAKAGGSTSTGPSPVTVTWDAPTSGTTPTAYEVKRGSTLISCNSSPCTDTGVDNGTYIYHVKSLYHTSWSSAAADSNQITVQNQAATMTHLESSDNPSVVGETVTFTATVSSAGSGMPSGSVTFKDGTDSITCEGGSAAFDGTSATCKFTYSATAGSPRAVTAVYSGDSGFFGSISNEVDQAVGKADQGISFSSSAPSNAKVGGATYTPTATGGGSGNPVTFTIDSAAAGICSISSGAVSFQHVGTCAVDANQAGSANYNAAPRTQQSFSVVKGDQTITFPSLSGVRLDQMAPTPAATTSSRLSVSYSTSSTACSVSAGGSIRLLHAGTCTINADQVGNADWNPAPQAQQTFSVNKGNQTINFPAPPGVRLDQPAPTPAATASSGLAVTYSTASTACSATNAGVITLLHAGSCAINGNQAGDADWNPATQVQQSFTISKGNQSINFPSLSGVRLDQSAPTPVATASSGLAVTYSTSSTGCSVTSAGVIALAHAGSCAIDGDQTGNTDWNPATQVQQVFTISRGNQTITFGAMANRRLDQSPLAVGATASSGLMVAFTSATTSTCTVSGTSITLLHTGNCTINADQAGNTDWNAATQVQQTFTINKGNQTITFGAAPAFARTGVASSVSATATSSLAVVFGSSTSSVCGVNSSTGALTLSTIGLCSLTGEQSGNTDWNAATQAIQSVQVYNGSTAGLAFSNVKVGSTSANPTCTGTIGTTYACTVSGQSNNSTISGNVVFVTSAGAASIFSAQAETMNFAQAGKLTGTGTVPVPGNGTTSTATVSGQMNGSNDGQVSVTYSLPGGGAWTAVLKVTR